MVKFIALTQKSKLVANKGYSSSHIMEAQPLPANYTTKKSCAMRSSLQSSPLIHKMEGFWSCHACFTTNTTYPLAVLSS
uniref:Uncharacterized protein n=1 Tax=Ditylenchus dipsaci TaxID=166011 RepID=A0A915DT67_9BILA